MFDGRNMCLLETERGTNYNGMHAIERGMGDTRLGEPSVGRARLGAAVEVDEPDVDAGAGDGAVEKLELLLEQRVLAVLKHERPRLEPRRQK